MRRAPERERVILTGRVEIPMKTVLALVTAVAIVATACSGTASPEVTASDTPMAPSSPATAATASASPSFAAPSASPAASGGLAVETLLTDHGIGSVRWAPGGAAFAAAVQSGTANDGRVEVFSADGTQRLATIPGGWDVGWLDPTSLAVLLERPDGNNGRVVIHFLDGRPEAQLPGARGAILASDAGRVAVTDPFASNAEFPTVFRILTAHPAAGGADGQRWVESGPIDAGWPTVWSADGNLLAVSTASSTASADLVAATGSEIGRRSQGSSLSRIRLAAGGAPPVRFKVLRFPDATRVPLPDLLLDPRSVWAFSPDDRWFAAVDGTTGETVVINVETAGVTRLAGYWPEGWTPTGQLVLMGAGGGTATLRSSDGTLTRTGLPAGQPSFGPLPGEVAIARPDPNGATMTGTIEVRMAGETVDIPTLGPPTAGEAFWSPDGRSCLVATPTDDAQQLHASLLRVTAP
jgi:hypothetical protein